MVNKEAVAEWVAELRSGNRAQATGTLDMVRNGQRAQCCLGVACDLFAERISLESVMFDEDDYVKVAYGTERQTGVLPTEMMAYLGLDGHPFFVFPLTDEQRRLDAQSGRPSGGYVGLAWLNDHGLTFDQIADVIEYATEYDLWENSAIDGW